MERPDPSALLTRYARVVDSIEGPLHRWPIPADRFEELAEAEAALLEVFGLERTPATVGLLEGWYSTDRSKKGTRRLFALLDRERALTQALADAGLPTAASAPQAGTADGQGLLGLPALDAALVWAHEALTARGLRHALAGACARRVWGLDEEPRAVALIVERRPEEMKGERDRVAGDLRVTAPGGVPVDLQAAWPGDLVFERETGFWLCGGTVPASDRELYGLRRDALAHARPHARLPSHSPVPVIPLEHLALMQLFTDAASDFDPFWRFFSLSALDVEHTRALARLYFQRLHAERFERCAERALGRRIRR